MPDPFATPPAPTLPTESNLTSTWGKRLSIRAGLFDSGGGAGPWAPFTECPDAHRWFRLCDVRAETDRPSTTSRDVTIYLTATQNYDNNPQIAAASGTTPSVDQQQAHLALFGRIQIGRGGITSEERFTIPAHGIALHVTADSVRVEAGFFPRDTQFYSSGAPDTDFRGALATGFDIQAGVGTGKPSVDLVRTPVLSSADAAAGPTIDVPDFARRVQLFHLNPQMFLTSWLDYRGSPINDAPATGANYAVLQPIPVDAKRLQIIRLLPLQTLRAIMQWEREA